jgi:tetratricopeptide (TPR) repeat protein
METNYFVINPFTSLVINFFAQDRIPMEEAQHYVGLIRDVVEHAVENCGDEQECEAWTIVEEYSLARLEELEGVRGFYDCEYYKIKYFADFEAHPDSCEVLRDVYSVLRYGGCIPEDPMLEEIKAGLDEKCRVAREPGPLRLAYNALEEGQFTEAIEKFDEYVENTEDPERKAQFKLIASKIYYAHLKDFPSARRYALEAASYRDNWGEPYILIGKLYASSGPLCGPGRGWDSQIVTWAAIDKFAYAKQIDPSVTAEANQWISTYSRYMPSMEDIFQRNLQVGQPFRVPCWIQENTSIRPAPRS